jgi:23S rRNA pseudouridine1911/1915/1917 synthase
LAVVNKPAGMLVHAGAGTGDDPRNRGTLVNALLYRFGALSEVGGDLRPGIVHRLDKDTSGLLVIARTPQAYDALVAQLADRSMGRTYLALALGHVVADEGTIDAPIGRSARQPTRMTVSTTGKAARSHYRVLRRFDRPVPTTLLEVVLETGRTHQIRVHLAAIGHPVAGDTRYGGRARELGLERPFLHAERLRFTHPSHGGVVELASGLPADLAGVLAQLS